MQQNQLPFFDEEYVKAVAAYLEAVNDTYKKNELAEKTHQIFLQRESLSNKFDPIAVDAGFFLQSITAFVNRDNPDAMWDGDTVYRIVNHESVSDITLRDQTEWMKNATKKITGDTKAKETVENILNVLLNVSYKGRALFTPEIVKDLNFRLKSKHYPNIMVKVEGVKIVKRTSKTIKLDNIFVSGNTNFKFSDFDVFNFETIEYLLDTINNLEAEIEDCKERY